ncbi:hypothetical protein JCM10212_005904 [Sporobolomyces blumeae]
MADPPTETEQARVPSNKALGKRPARLEASESSPLSHEPTPGTTTSVAASTSSIASSSSAQVTAAPPGVKGKVQAREKRITRSSLGGNKVVATEDVTLSSEGATVPLHLPLKTPVLLTTRLLSGLTHHPPPNRGQFPAQESSSSSPLPNSDKNGLDSIRDERPIGFEANPKARGGVDDRRKDEKPLFRLMNETEFLLPRGTRHGPLVEVDTSDALYHRLHRYPEVLEKRASRLERERLIHERSKLILELEELRGRGWVYVGNASGLGGRAEEERQKKIRQGEERLSRYDALLPNQPRKSNFLNLGGSTGPQAVSSLASAPPSVPAHNNVHARPLSASPAPALPLPIASTSSLPTRSRPSLSRSRPTPLRSSAMPSSSSTPRIRHGSAPSDLTLGPEPGRLERPPTPVSATSAGGSNGMRIRIKFDANPVPSRPIDRTSIAPVPARGYGGGKDPHRGLAAGARVPAAAKGSKRPRASSGKDATKPRPRPRNGERKMPSRARKGEARYADFDDEVDELDPSDSSLSDLDDGEGEAERDQLEDEEEVDQLLNDSFDSTTGEPRPDRRRRRASTTKYPRIRLPNSFFQSAALRDSIFPPPRAAASGPGAKPPPTRRSSSRVAYAFGHRLPDAALLRQAEFELHGGTSAVEAENAQPGYSAVKLEELVQERAERSWGDQVVVIGGRVLPKSAVDAWMVDPVRKREVSSNGGSVNGVEEAVLDPAAPRIAAFDPSPAAQDSPATSNDAEASGSQSTLQAFAPPPSSNSFTLSPVAPKPRPGVDALDADTPSGSAFYGDDVQQTTGRTHHQTTPNSEPRRYADVVRDSDARDDGSFSFALPAVKQVLFATVDKTPSGKATQGPMDVDS